MKSFNDVVDFHGHSCPGLAFGYRVAMAALREIGQEKASEDEELVAVVENDSCAVDAIQVLTGCTFGKGNLTYKDHGKQVYTFIKRPSGEAVRISVGFTSPEETEEERNMWKQYTQGDRSEEILKVLRNRKAKKTKAVLEAAEAELLKITKVDVVLPAEARIYQSVTCTLCGEEVAEPRARIKEGKVVCIPCFEGSP
ncbi:MAG TPA: formylmethanofuran dehydrogenase [Nitrospiraceae bacterium]|jgi:formylmethanofuran dehydrogenase subunit E|nr:formylmethanofuran dehydrogenase [Nitrospiraceae bacterium]